MKHTPGPWYVNEIKPRRKIKQGFCVASNEGPITFLETMTLDYISTLKANARLIAAAPDLLEACQEAQEVLMLYWGTNTKPLLNVLTLIDKAITKATFSRYATIESEWP